MFPPSRWAFLILAIMSGFLQASSVRADGGRPDIELYSVETRLYPRLELDDPQGGAEEKSRVRPLPLRFYASLPIRYRSLRSRFSIGIGYERLDFDVEDWNPADPFPDGPFHSVQLPMSYVRSLKSRGWTSRFFLAPGVSSDFKGSAGDGFRLQGGGFLEKRGGRGTLSFGVVLINDYGVPRVFPAVSWSGRPAPRQNVVLRLPILASWSVDTASRTEVGVAFRVNGGNYAIGRGPFRDMQLKYSTAVAGPFVKRSFGRTSVQLEIGRVFRHELDVYDDSRHVRDHDLKGSGYAAATLNLFL